MPWAMSGRISSDPIEGGIAISDEQYAEALAGIHDGKLIIVDDGVFSIVAAPIPELSATERRLILFAAIRAELSSRYDAALSPARRQLAQIDATRIRRKAIEERTEAESERLADIDQMEAFFETLEHHAAMLAVEVEDLEEASLAAWEPHSWPEP